MVELKSKYQETRDKYQFEIGKKESLELQLKKDNDRIIEIEKLDKLYQECSVLLQKLEDNLKTTIVDQIEIIMTQALNEVLENPNLKFKVIYEAKRNVIGVEFKIYDLANGSTFDILNSFGGGIADLVSVVLRIVFLHYSGLEKILVLDESGKFISNNYQGNFSKFLKTIAEKLDMQIILVSHKKEVSECCNRIIEVEKINNISKIEIKCQ